MAETNGNPDIRLHIGADVAPSTNTIRTDLANAFKRAPIRVDFGVSNDSKTRIRAELQSIMEENQIKLPVQVVQTGLDFAALSKQYKDLSARVTKLDIDTTPYQKKLDALAAKQRKLATTPVGSADYEKLTRSYMRDLQNLLRDLDAAEKLSGKNNTFVNQKNFKERVALVESYKTQIAGMGDEATELRTLLDSVEKNIENTKQALSTKVARSVFAEANDDMKELTKRMQAIQRQSNAGASGSGGSGGSGAGGGGGSGGGGDPSTITESVAFRNMNLNITEARRQLNLLKGDTGQLGTVLKRVEDEMQAALDATEIEDARQHWENARVAMTEYRIELSKFQSGGAAADRSKKLFQQVDDQHTSFEKLRTDFTQLKSPTDALRNAFEALDKAQDELEKNAPTQTEEWVRRQLALVKQLTQEYQKQMTVFQNMTPTNPVEFRQSKEYLDHVGGVQDYLTRARTALSFLPDDNKQHTNEVQTLTSSIDELDAHLAKLQGSDLPIEELNREMKNGVQIIRRFVAALKGVENIQSLDSLKMQASTALNEFEAYLTKVHPKGLTRFAEEIEAIRQGYANLPDDAEAAQEQIKILNDRTKNLGSEMRKFGYEGGNAFEFVTEKMKSYATYLVSSLLTDGIYRVFRQIVTSVKELDAALTDIRMVTGDNVEAAGAMLEVYNEIAKTLGTSTIDVSSAATEWLRQGYSESETNQLIRDSMVLSRVGFMESAEAAQALTAAMKGYEVAAGDAMSIVDKFTQVDQLAATSAGNLATALSKTAANAKVAGLELDEVIGYLAVVNEVLQEEPESTGTFMNTLLSRMGNIKAGRLNDPESGEDLSDVETTLRSLGIQLRSSDSEFRDFGEVLQEVGARWDQYSTVQQRAIAVAFSGTRQQTRFLTLMEGFDQAQKYITASAESGGSALEKFGAYEDSLEYKTQRLTATFEEFADNLVDSRVLGFFTDLGTRGLEALGSFEGTTFKTLTAIPAILGAITAFEAIKTSSIGTHFKTIIKTFNEAGGAAGSAAAGIKTLWGAMKSHKGISITGGILAAASIAVSVYQSIQENAREAARAANEAADVLDQNSKSVEGYISKAEGLKKSLDSGTLSVAETRDVRAQLVEIQNAVVDMLGREAEGFDIVAGSIENATEWLRAYNQESAQEWIREEGDAISKARTYMEKERTHRRYVGDDASIWLGADADAIAVAIEEYLANDEHLSAAAYSTDQYAHLYDLTGKGTYLELQEAYRGLYDFISGLEDQYGVRLDDMLTVVSESLGDINGKLEDDRAQTYLTLLDKQSEADFNDLYNGIQNAERQLDEAYADNSIVGLRDAFVALNDVFRQYEETSFDEEDEVIQKYLQSMLDKVQEQSSDYLIRLNLTGFDVDNDMLKTSMEKVRTAFSGEDEITDVSALQDVLTLYNQVKASAEQGRTISLANVGLTAEQYDALVKLDAALQASGGSLESLITNTDLQNSLFGESVEILSDEESAFARLQQALNTTETEYTSLQNLLDAIGNNDIGTYLAGDDEALARLEELQKTYPEIVSALKDYADGLITIDELHGQVLSKASLTFLDDLTGSYEDVCEAAANYGWDSWQVQSAMTAMAAIMPGLKTQLYNQKTGMWDVSEAALKAAMSTDTLRGALNALFNMSVTSSTQSKIDDIVNQLNNTSSEIQQAALTTKLNELMAQKKLEDAQIDRYLETTQKAFDKIWEDAQSSANRGGGGGSSKSVYEQMKEELDAYIESQKHYIDMLGRQIEVENRASVDHADEAGQRIDGLTKTIDTYRDMQTAVKELIASYESMGLTEESQQIIRELEDMWWEYEEAIVSSTDNVISALDALTEETTSSIDSLQEAYQTLRDAATEYAANGYITVDTLQSIIGLGVEYLSYLKDENGQLVINAENIEKVLAAKTEQLAVDTAFNYVKKLGIALEAQDEAMLNQLLTATSAATSATWDLVYAQLALLDLDSTQYQQALDNINALRSLAEATNTTLAANTGAGSQNDYYSDAADALQTILDLTMDLIRHENDEMVDALEKQKDKYKEIIDLKKEALQDEADDEDYSREIDERLAEISDLQSDIDRLKLDNSREALAERLELEEKLAEKQADLAEFQADHALDTQLDVLDDEYDAYEETKDKEIEATKQAVSSTEKIYQQAIARINNDWNGLYQDLLAWNEEYGSTLQQDLIDAWGKATEAVQRYGSYVDAVTGVQNETLPGGAGIPSGNFTEPGATAGTAGDTGTSSKPSWYDDDIDPITYDKAMTFVNKMKANSQAWLTASPEQREVLQDDNEYYADRIAAITGKKVVRDQNGVWWIDDEELYEKFKYHTGGVAGNHPTLKQNELLSLLEEGEVILDQKKQNSAFKLVDFMGELSKVVTAQIGGIDISSYIKVPTMRAPAAAKTAPVTNAVNWSPSINVAINHSGSMTDADAKRFGKTIANTALGDLKEAFAKRGINSFNPIKA